MKIGDKVYSILYKNKGIGTIVSFSELFGEKFAEVLFPDNEVIQTKVDDLYISNNPIQLLKSSKFDKAEIFIAKNLLIKIEENLLENKIVTSTNFKIKPLPHQLLTVNFVINRFKPRCLIADEVGLGKTIEAALVYEEFKLRGIVKKILIIVPSGLVLQWQEELLNKFNENFVVYTKNYIRMLKQSYGEETNVWQIHDKIIASIDSIKLQKISDNLSKEEKKKREWHNKHVFEHLTEAGFDMVIIDEAHKLSKYEDGYETARYKLGQYLGENVPILLLLTATPHQGKSDLFLNLLKLIDPVLFTSYSSLKPELVKEVSVRNKKRAVVDFDGKRIFKNRITSLIEISRDIEKNKKEIELYEKITTYTHTYYNIAIKKGQKAYILLLMLYQRIASSSSFAILSAMQRRLEFLESENKSQIEPLETSDIDDIIKVNLPEDMAIDIEKTFLRECIDTAREIAENFYDAKFNKLLEIIEETIRREEKPDLKFIIFTEFKATQQAIIKFLEKFGYSCAYINGDLSREEKVIQVVKFKEESQILVSTDAGGEGINLQFCYCMINFDLPWNPSRLEQRIGRIDRIGQTKDVLVFNFHLKDTVEDRVREILEAKLNIIKMQFGEDKLADVLDLLQDEFSFDKIYIDAITKLKEKDEELDKIADEIYKKAHDILEKDEFILPFTNFQEDAKQLLNNKLNQIMKNLVFNVLKFKNIEVLSYKEEKQLYRFKNPYIDNPNLPSNFRYVTFNPDIAMENPKADMINVEHLLFNQIKDELTQNNSIGLVSALRARINKFQGIKGIWFVYKLQISNNINRKKLKAISVFMEDEDFCNNRISKYLDENILENFEIIQNLTLNIDLDKAADTARAKAEEKARDIYETVKFQWIDEIDKYEKKLEEYFVFKKRGILNIPIENIRESKLKSLNIEFEEQLLQYKKQKNIVPKIELFQVGFLEFC
jgi:superfamily II DNA or RNA helicase